LEIIHAIGGWAGLAATSPHVAGFRFNDLRHTFASHFVMRGGTLQTVKEILGHGSVAMTAPIRPPRPEHVRGEMERTAAAQANQPW
jgi:site-specific recombinase XerD